MLCNLGTLTNNASATVTINVSALTAGAVQNTAQVSAAQGDPNLSNNTATTSTVITGSPYNPLPVLSGISPSFVQAGSSSFELTLSGNQFTSTSQVLWNGNALPTTYASSTQLTAQVDGSLIAAMGWAWITVSNPAPGGGISTGQPVTVYSEINLDTNHLVFDPFTRQLYVSIPSTAPQVQGNSIVSIDPNTGSLGTLVSIGSEPAKLAESDDGLYLYTLLLGADSLARFNLTTGIADSTTYPFSSWGTARDLTVLPGTNNSLAIDLGSSTGSGIFDISQGGGMFRGTDPDHPTFTGGYTGSNLVCPDASHLYTLDTDTSGGEFYRWSIACLRPWPHRRQYAQWDGRSIQAAEWPGLRVGRRLRRSFANPAETTGAVSDLECSRQRWVNTRSQCRPRSGFGSSVLPGRQFLRVQIPY